MSSYSHSFSGASLVLAGLLASVTPALAKKTTGSTPRLPDPVAKTFKATFPKAKISKLDVDQENGVTVYDLEFMDGTIEKETDITADGTMLEFTIVVDAKAVPSAAMDTIRKAAAGSTIARIEHVEIGYETKHGKAIKLPRPMTQYAVEIVKTGQSTEIVVAPDGTVVERAK